MRRCRFCKADDTAHVLRAGEGAFYCVCGSYDGAYAVGCTDDTADVFAALDGGVVGKHIAYIHVFCKNNADNATDVVDAICGDVAVCVVGIFVLLGAPAHILTDDADCAADAAPTC